MDSDQKGKIMGFDVVDYRCNADFGVIIMTAVQRMIWFSSAC